MSHQLSLSFKKIYCLVLISGLAALSWEVIWQIKATLALGASAWGTALVLAVTMGGMSLGALLTGNFLKNRTVENPLKVYGWLEAVIGLSGLSLSLLFKGLETLDTTVYTTAPGYASLIHILGIALTLGLPTFCMGATLPVLGLIARRYQASIAHLYGLNTLGAAVGVLCAAFVFIPLLGIAQAAWIIAALNFVVALISIISVPSNQEGHSVAPSEQITKFLTLSPLMAVISVIITGYATFSLEVAWFRSLTAAFQSTTDAFAIMLSSVLIALGMASKLVLLLKRKGASLGMIIALAGILILLTTPIIERFDMMTSTIAAVPLMLILQWFLGTLIVVGLPMTLLGVALPWVLDEQGGTRKWGQLYALNAMAAITGALSAGWIFLPLIGFAGTAWLAGILVGILGISILPKRQWVEAISLVSCSLLIAVICESGVGKTRTQGWMFSHSFKPSKVLEAHEGPNATVSAVEYDNGGRALIIDGFVAAAQFTAEGQPSSSVHYMAWMGHLPMLLHQHPENALVICFGTGQTANAVRQENPKHLDIVDLNPQVLKLGHYFFENEGVLEDPRVSTTIMDGRAYIRRTQKTYDAITLEPMPPVFAGVNSLYSREFYQLARARLSPQGTIAQWVPFHLIDPEYSASISKTFQSVFPNAILWIDPGSKTGILLGSKDDAALLGQEWPGYNRKDIKRDLSLLEVRKGVLMNSDQLKAYGAHGKIISDDNQLLAYGRAVYLQHYDRDSQQDNMKLIDSVIKTGKN